MKPDARGECWEKVQVVESLESSFGDARIVEFFLRVLGDSNEWDMARVELCKFFELNPPASPLVRERVAGTISKALRSEPDVLVRQWLAIAAAGYIDFELVFNSISERLLDGKEDMDVRYNCLASLEELGPTKKVLAVYEMLRNRPSPMSDTVKRHLNEWSTAKHKR